MRKFKCECCGEEFETDWTDEMAQSEFENNFSEAERLACQKIIVCDDCYNKIMPICRMESEK